MPELAILRSHDGHSDTAPSVNFIVVPGIAGATLGDKTCPHVDDFLAAMITNCQSKACAWVYDNDIVLNKLESWDKYSSNGLDLLQQLLSMQDKAEFHKDSTLILIGHKLGYYILKKALLEAWNDEHKPDQKRLLDNIETIMMIGEPILDPKKRDQWIGSVSECFSNKKALPQHLANGATVGSLNGIAEEFADINLKCTVVDVDGTALKPRPKLFNFKKREHDGCICPNTVCVRMWTTENTKQLIEKALGEVSRCAFHPKSAHYHNLLSFNPMSIVPTTPAEGEESGNTETFASLDEQGQSSIGDRDQNVVPVLAQVSGVIQVRNFELDASHTTIAPNKAQPDKLSDECHSSTMSSSHDTQKDKMTSQCDKLTPQEIRAVLEPVSNIAQRERKFNFQTAFPPKVNHFTGRDAILEQITGQIPPVLKGGVLNNQVHSWHPKIVWLEGPIGIGKTSIAVEFAHRSAKEFSNIIYCNASSAASWGSSCHDSAVAMGLVDGRISQNHETSRQMLMSWLEASSEKWLLILDNLPRDASFIRGLPNCAQGLIIATSRSRPLILSSKGIAICDIQIPPWSLSEAEDFMVRATRRKYKELDYEVLKESARRCHGIPLYLRQMADTYRKDKEFLKAYNNLLASAESKFLREDRAYTNLFLTAAISNLDIRQARLLGSLSFLKPERISKRILRFCCDCSLRDDPNFDEIIGDTSRQLWKLSLLDMDETQTSFRMHSAIQLKVSSGLNSQWPSQRKFKNIVHGFWDDFQPLHDHTHHLTGCVVEAVVKSQKFQPNGQFNSLLLKNSWYNGRRGNEEEDKTLHSLATMFCHRSLSKFSKDEMVPLPLRCLVVPEDLRQPVFLENTGRVIGNYVACSLRPKARRGAIASLSPKYLQQYRDGLDIQSLPQNILRAIEIARENRIYYVWVDGLCIDQSDAMELSEEVPRLMEYFSNSSITIHDAKSSTGSYMISFHPNDRRSTIADPVREFLSIISEATETTTPVQERSLHAIDNIPSKLFRTADHILENTSSTEPSERATDLSTIQDISTPEINDSSSKMMPLSGPNYESKGWTLLENGKSQLVSGCMDETIGSLILCRDAFRVEGTLTYDDMDGYANASAILSTTFRLLKQNTIALSIAQNALSLCEKLRDIQTSAYQGYQLLLFTLGMALYHTGQLEQAQEQLKESRTRFAASRNTISEWTASIGVQLASIYATSGNYQEAQELLQSSMNFFQAQLQGQPMSMAAKGHVARILFRQSRLHQKQNSTFMYNIISAAASSALAELRPPSEKPSLENGSGTQEELTDRDFDALVEPWYR